MIRLARDHSARVVLLDNELWDGSPYRPVLRAIAADEGVPLVDSLAIVAAARERMEREIEARLGLEHAPHDRPPRHADAAAPADAEDRSTRVVFRVSRGAYAVPTALSIVGPVPQLGDSQPNALLMHDDGTGGDERGGDGVWSFATEFAPGAHVTYVYTNSGARGRWQGLDVPHLRDVVIPPATDDRPTYLPIETFGRVYMQADDWHTDAAGYDLIARAVAAAIVTSERR
jgi:hypothetical protein